ncbi:hypothetical protein E3Q23_01783 [Wallemia mellicola]|uniref:tRNA pseudouridine(55) synthase n=1 Tax=Wallemia mellicola TaxID=1708541 RepID=A0A4T0QH74_9BASI|nr:hypothetical protein E3Q23_01783 [Wallemia mellicola]TIC07379.1 pseudouridine synthase [Wallemia mellicola]TIC17136.1 pseudouridine synthase [Wallemia mellicola]TIC22263.1 pseudouridine synthase [Wallemia mellicola]TIC23094.1 pseudouridine synthase [Wallemia mellicola]
MPKTHSIHYPLSGLFALNKPSGITSMALLDSLKPLFGYSQLFKPHEDAPPPLPSDKKKKGNKWRKSRGGGARGVGGYAVKVGQGGTLDPLADGVLVVGLNKGTKKLADLLNCSKEYTTIGLLGCETDSYDSEGAVVSKSRWQHITKSDIENALEGFRGEIDQLPPIFSAIKIEGKRLFEYARAGETPPKPVEKRKCTIHSLTLEEFIPGDKHAFRYPVKELSSEDKEAAQKAQEFVASGTDNKSEEKADDEKVDKVLEGSEEPQEEPSEQADKEVRPPTAFKLRMTVSGGTYVRSIVHDLGKALGSSAHVVELTRTRQGEFALANASTEDGGVSTGSNVLDWSVFEKALAEKSDEYKEGELQEWEQDLMRVIRTDI